MKNKTIRNYLILFGIFIITFIICLYAFSWINQYNEVRVGEPIISDTLKEIKYDNLDGILKENELVPIYMCVTSDKLCRNYEKKFSKFIKENNLTDDILYLNLGYRNIENNILERLYNNYKHEYLIKKITSYPTIVIFNNGKIIDFISVNDNYDIDIINEFLKGYKIND